jgi:hypothetical protein
MIEAIPFAFGPKITRHNKDQQEVGNSRGQPNQMRYEKYFFAMELFSFGIQDIKYDKQSKWRILTQSFFVFCSSCCRHTVDAAV